MRLPLQHRSVQKRNGFTLIELLVVIAILILLMALTLGVMSRVYGYLDEVKVTSDVTRLAESCNLFKAEFGRFPPGKIILCENGAAYNIIITNPAAMPPPPTSGLSLAQWSALGAYSVEYLSSIFPAINLTVAHDWNGNGSLDNPVLLEGHQCLVFFLGGMRYGTGPAVGCVGFNTDKTIPTALSNGARKGPFFDFDGARLNNNFTPPAYNDPYGTPYAYFGARDGIMNNYPNMYVPTALIAPNDCHGLTTFGPFFFVPYFQGTVPTTAPANWGTANSFKFAKSDTFQIISAGKDKMFGTGGQYFQGDPEQSLFIPQSALPAVTQEMLQANYDNITNVTNGRVVPK